MLVFILALLAGITQAIGVALMLASICALMLEPADVAALVPEVTRLRPRLQGWLVAALALLGIAVFLLATLLSASLIR